MMSKKSISILLLVSRCSLPIASAAIFALCCHGGLAAQAAAMPHVDEVNPGKSVFIDDPRFGKDPFFPRSSRRKPAVVVPVRATPETGLYTQVLSAMVLKGISGLPGRRLALLNNRTVAAGEVLQVNYNNQTFKVRCLEIRDKSVLLGVDGSKETKEISFRSTL